MAEINWNNVYNDYKNQYKDAFKAAEYTVFGRLTGSKKTPTTYTQDEWYQYEAPDYWAIVSKPPAKDDPLGAKTAEIKNAKSPSDVFAIADSAGTSNIGIGSGTLFKTTADYRDYLMVLYNQKVQAEKKASSSGANWWKQYDLPNPSERYEADKKNFDTAEAYIKQQTATYARKIGRVADAKKKLTDFENGLRKTIYKNINASGISPFLVAAQKRIKARG